jgi:hypothetical protein
MFNNSFHAFVAPLQASAATVLPQESFASFSAFLRSFHFDGGNLSHNARAAAFGTFNLLFHFALVFCQ